MSFRPLESEPQSIARSELQLSTPTCQHEHYERFVEDDRFARAQCQRCPHSWVEVDISVDRPHFSGARDPVRRYPKLLPSRFDGSGLEPVPGLGEFP